MKQHKTLGQAIAFFILAFLLSYLIAWFVGSTFCNKLGLDHLTIKETLALQILLSNMGGK